jgi:hypothetical protein
MFAVIIEYLAQTEYKRVCSDWKSLWFIETNLCWLLSVSMDDHTLTLKTAAVSTIIHKVLHLAALCHLKSMTFSNRIQ